MIPVFFRDEQVVEIDSYSKSAEKPSKVIANWKDNFLTSISINSFDPVSISDISLVHNQIFVDNIVENRASNGFGIINEKLTKSLFYTSGSLYAAAKKSLETGIAVSPTSGFHHAGYATAGGFCTFNGLMITTSLMIKNHGIRKVGILDFDFHYGNGTDNIIKILKMENVVHYTAGKHFQHPSQGQEFLNTIPEILNRFEGCDLILYQAGADQYINDPLGGLLTKEQLQDRDLQVFRYFKSLNIPLVWNLAGGYTNPFSEVLTIHNNTMKACIEVYS